MHGPLVLLCSSKCLNCEFLGIKMVILHSFLDIKESFPETGTISLPLLKKSSLNIEFLKSDSNKPIFNGSEPPLPFADSGVFQASIVHSRQLTASVGDCKAIYEVTFDVEGSYYNFKAGDTIGVIPYNDESNVNYIISHLNLDSKADLHYTITVDSSVKGSKVPAHVPVQSTLRHVLTHCLDLRSVLKKLFLLALSKYTKDETERKILEYLCSKEGSAAYTTYILNKGVCLLDIFINFTTCKPPVEVLLANLPRLLPRPYSIVNSGLKNNKLLTICFSVMTVNNRKGLTTGWLENLILNKETTLENQIKNLSLNDEKKVAIYLRKKISMFSLPEDMKKPLILIGPGTGVAPFIGFLEEREFVKENNLEMELGECWLFFGCRDPKLDFIYEEELNGFLSRGILDKLSTAFSRADNAECKYVQDAISKNMKDIVRLIDNGGIVFVCGDLKAMEVEVRELIVKGFIDNDNMTTEEAKTKMEKMQKDKRYLVDAWC